MLDTLSPDTLNQSRALPSGFNALESLIGNTPMVAVRIKDRGEVRTVHAKLEYFNLSGSIKDRMALEVLRCAYRTGALQPGDLIVEATSGNAGIAFCALGRALCHPVRIYMPDWMSAERIALMRGYGAEVVLVSREEDGFLGSIAMAEALARERNDVFLPRQFSNPDNCHAHQKTTGPEIVAQMGGCPDMFVAGVGTGGTVTGVGRALRNICPKSRIHPLEPAESPTLSTGYKTGKHRIQGVSDDFIPEICDLANMDAVVAVNDGDAILMAQALSATLGLGVGISSGANLVGAIKLLRERPGASVVTIFCDDNKKYLTTDLTKVEPVVEGYVSPDIELLDFSVL